MLTTGGTTAWTKTTLGVRGQMSVTCPSTTLCVAAVKGSIFTATNPTGGASAWTKTTISGPDFTAITCPTTALCLAGTGTGKLYTSTNPTGGASAWTIPWTGSVATLAITAISCASTTLCVAATATDDPTDNLNDLGVASHVYTSTAPTSSAWNSAIIGVGSLNGVACPSTSFCVATQKTGRTYTSTTPTASHNIGDGYVAATWTLNATGNTATIGGVSCPSTTFCVAGESKHTGVLVMTGSTHGVRSSATYGTTNDLLSTSSLTVGGTTTTTATYGYDTLGQLTSSTMTGTPGATGSYTYDAGGDPTKVVDPANGTATAQTFNTNQQVTKATPHSTSGADATFTYDSIGARTSEKESSWSAANTYGYYQTGELKSVSQHTSGTSASYIYDGEGLRTKATETINTSTHESQTFTWDTETKTPELLADGSHYFIYGPTGQVIEQENETATLKGTLYLVHNTLGSTVATITSTHVVSTVSYNAYGSVVGHTGNVNTTPIGYAGAYSDPVTGFLALLHRYYDPTTGQFLSIDPDVGTTHEPYEYAGGDPVNLDDPSGLDCGGGPTLGAFAAAYQGWQLEELAATYEYEQASTYSAAYLTHQAKTLENAYANGWAKANQSSCTSTFRTGGGITVENTIADTGNCSVPQIVAIGGFEGCAVSSHGGGCYTQWYSIGQTVTPQDHTWVTKNTLEPLGEMDGCSEGAAAGGVALSESGPGAIAGAMAGCVVGVGADYVIDKFSDWLTSQ